MLLADSNIWLALAVSKHQFHDVARDWFSGLKPREVVCFCRNTQQSFLRLLTTREVLLPYAVPPLTNEQAWSTYEGFLANKRITFVVEPTHLEDPWKSFAAQSQSSPKLWSDAYLAAFALAGSHRLVTTDKGFKQFPGLNLLLLSL
jgi:toxin-antitoxin system PIN domain toxin